MPLFLEGDAEPFTVAQQQAIGQAWDLFPERFRRWPVTVAQIPEQDWPHGEHSARTDMRGDVFLKAGVWPKIPGLVVHELAHSFTRTVMSGEEWRRWAACYAGREDECGHDYGRGDPEEGWAQAVVSLLCPGTAGYRPASAAVLEMVGELLR
jgi:hypothetical protein